MKIFKLVLIIAIISFHSAIGQRVKKTGEELIPQGHLLEDLEKLRSWITEAHGDPYRFTSKADLEQRFQEAERKIRSTESLKGIEFYGLLLPIMAELRDGHSKALPPDLDRFYGKTILPLGLHFHKERPYVLNNFGNEQLPEGAEILEINGINATKFFERLAGLISRDGDVRTSRFHKLENPLFLANLMKGLGLAKNEYKVKFKHNQSTNSLTLAGIDQATYQGVSRSAIKKPKKRQPLSLDMPESPKNAAVMKISTFNPSYYENSQQVFNRQLDMIMRQVNDKGIEHLILDLRGNSGGEDTYYAYLLRYFMKTDFRLYGEVTAQKGNYKFLPDGHHWDIDPRAFKARQDDRFDVTRYLWEDPDNHGLQQFSPLDGAYSGKVYVLIDGATFSAAAELASFFKHYKLATLIGEETAGSAIGTVAGYTPTFTLENSGVHINLALISIKRTFFYEAFTDRGVIPDVSIQPSVEDRLAGKDVVLAKALELTRNRQ